MSRRFSLSAALVMALLPAATFAAPAHKRPLHPWHGYGFLPGYHQPPNNTVPVFGPKGAIGNNPYDLDAPQYWNGGWYYFGRPGYFRGRYNGGSFGPCWTQTPIGPMWNCG